MRKPLMAGNWKMYKTPAQTSQFFEKFVPLVADLNDRDIAICPPSLDLPSAIAATAETNVGIGGQNIYWMKEGAFTGEVSGPMLKAAGCKYVLVGHSERRQFFHETDATVLKRAVAALDAGLTPIVCVGEMLEERKGGTTGEVLARQVEQGIAPLTQEQAADIVVAYEPVWAIGTGLVATPEVAAETHALLRSLLGVHFGRTAGSLRILYGGSVKPDNVKGLMAEEEIDGVLVGGASLDPESFATIVRG